MGIERVMSVEWDKHNCARLAESIDTRGEDPPQCLEIQKRDVFFIGTNPPELKERLYDITIWSGDTTGDKTFYGLSERQICEIAESMIRLVGGTFRIDPPPAPEIKF